MTSVERGPDQTQTAQALRERKYYLLLEGHKWVMRSRCPRCDSVASGGDVWYDDGRIAFRCINPRCCYTFEAPPEQISWICVS